MLKINVAIAGCTKNSGSYIENSINKILSWSKNFKIMNIFIFENDSQDNTVEVLKKNSDRINIISEKNVIGSRTEVLAYARNQLINSICADTISYDYIIMVDLDDAVSKLDAGEIYECFTKYKSDWAALVGNSPLYYDIWALRIRHDLIKKQKTWKTQLTSDCWQNVKRAYLGGINYNQAKKKYIGTYQVPLNKDDKLIEIDSGFNGIGIYKTKYLVNCKYNGQTIINGSIVDICEHVNFHFGIKKNGGKIYICSSLMTGGYEEHIVT